jgi:hypothetical protein
MRTTSGADINHDHDTTTTDQEKVSLSTTDPDELQNAGI